MSLLIRRTCVWTLISGHVDTSCLTLMADVSLPQTGQVDASCLTLMADISLPQTGHVDASCPSSRPWLSRYCCCLFSGLLTGFVVVVAVVKSGVPRRVSVSWRLHQRDVAAESRQVSDGTQSSDPDTWWWRLGQRTERYAVRWWYPASWRATAPSAELPQYAAGLVQECVRWRWLWAGACQYLFLCWAQGHCYQRWLDCLMHDTVRW